MITDASHAESCCLHRYPGSLVSLQQPAGRCSEVEQQGGSGQQLNTTVTSQLKPLPAAAYATPLPIWHTISQLKL